jgi:hypothetical protein
MVALSGLGMGNIGGKQNGYFTGEGERFSRTADFLGFPAVHGIKQPRPD